MLKAKVRRKLKTLTRGVDNLSTPLSYSNVPEAQCPYVRITAELDERGDIKAKAKAKAIQIPLIVKLIDLAKLRGDKVMEDGYRDAIYCQSRLVSDNSGQIVGRNCGKHWCRSCTRIRQFQRIEKYLPAFQELQNPYRVTLHRPNVPDSDLHYETRWHIKARRLILDRLRKRKVKVVGLWKIETTYNEKFDNYHPHTMWLIEGEEVANAITDIWCELNPTANPKAQQVVPITKTKESLEEVVKYTIKPTIDDKKYFINSLDVMYSAITGLRTLQPMGNFGKGEKDTEKEVMETTAKTYSFLENKEGEWEWAFEDKDWTHVKLQEKLCQWTKPELMELEEEIEKEEERIIYNKPTPAQLYERVTEEKRMKIDGIDCVRTIIVEGLSHRIPKAKRIARINVGWWISERERISKTKKLLPIFKNDYLKQYKETQNVKRIVMEERWKRMKDFV